MKVRCSCGTKYAFDVTPEMVANPIRFVCQNCGTDNSAGINALIQQQFGAAAAATAAPPSVPEPARADSTAAPTDAPAPVAPPSSAPRLKVHMAAAPAHVEPAPAAPVAPRMCVKHPGELLAHQCVVCHKPMCPKCMELFGWVCSPMCKSDAEARGITVPVYAMQASARQAAGWRHFRLVTLGIFAAIGLLIGAWSWYSFSLSKPKAVFAVRFDDAADHGYARFVAGNDAIVLRGGRLMRYDIKGKKELWHSELVDKASFAPEAAAIAERQRQFFTAATNRRDADFTPAQLRDMQPRPEGEIADGLAKAAADSMHLHVFEKNVWVRSPQKMVRYDIESGKAAQEIALTNGGWVHEVKTSGDSVVLLQASERGELATRVNLTSGQTDTQTLIARPAEEPVVAVKNSATNKTAAKAGATNRTAAAQLASARTSTNRTATGQQSPGLKQFKGRRELSFPEQIAAPALAANQVNQQRLNAAMADDDDKPAMEQYLGKVVMTPDGKFLQCSVKLLEHKVIERQAMKAPPKKSALDGDVNQASTMAVANEILNEMQRDRTGGVEEEDVSRYEVTLKRMGTDTVDWTGEVVGQPQFFALPTVNLLVAGKTVHVFDQSNKKLWQAQLSAEIGFVSEENDEFFGSQAGAPAVEQGKALYFRDQGMLTCFDLASGNVRWRLPSVGVSHILFDDKGYIYADTTTATSDSLKYSQQIDVSRKDHPLVIKVDPLNGKLLWKSENNGRLAHIKGKLIYTLEWMGGVETGEENPFGVPGAYVPPHVRIRRLSPGSGKVLWEHYQRRAPLDVRFNEKTIEILFRKEFQVLSYWSL